LILVVSKSKGLKTKKLRGSHHLSRMVELMDKEGSRKGLKGAKVGNRGWC